MSRTAALVAIADLRKALAGVVLRTPMYGPGAEPTAADVCGRILEMIEHGIRQVEVFLGPDDEKHGLFRGELFGWEAWVHDRPIAAGPDREVILAAFRRHAYGADYATQSESVMDDLARDLRPPDAEESR